MSGSLGTCRLCGQSRELRDSHLLPKAVYRYLRSPGEQDPTLVTPRRFGPTSKQIKARLLCSECEQRFNDGGERWMLRHGHRGFRLRELLLGVPPHFTTEYGPVFSCAAIPNVDVQKLTHFALSVFWRTAVYPWSGAEYQIDLGKRYESEIRAFLLGTSEFPANAVLTVWVADSEMPDSLFCAPYGGRWQHCFQYEFFMQGVLFRLLLGSKLPLNFRQMCFVRSPEHLVLLTSEVERLAKSGAMSRIVPLVISQNKLREQRLLSRTQS